VAAPLVRLNQSMPRFWPFGPPMSATSPVGVPGPDLGATVTLTFTVVPCVMLTGLPAFKVKAVLLAAKTAPVVDQVGSVD
jgi:hypothetical protein